MQSIIDTSNQTRDDAAYFNTAYFREWALELVIDYYDLDLYSSDMDVHRYEGIYDFSDMKGHNIGYDPEYQNDGETIYTVGGI